MRVVALVLLCTACAEHGSRWPVLQTSDARAEEANALKGLASLMLAFNPVSQNVMPAPHRVSPTVPLRCSPRMRGVFNDEEQKRPDQTQDGGSTEISKHNWLMGFLDTFDKAWDFVINVFGVFIGLGLVLNVNGYGYELQSEYPFVEIKTLQVMRREIALGRSLDQLPNRIKALNKLNEVSLTMAEKTDNK
mmetsp:Transcript_66750/g.123317  ORF Transcript_66750/g.123317 Transcript_66750/m.123317 type:complete len:191 (-) Transcript_66750:86-658(-)